jgi:hypothetical protein
VQQKTTNLPIAPLKKVGKGIALTELRNSSRRLHAKLLAWESENGTGCLVGSANFTLAAFDARNVEACLLLSDVEEAVSSLFDGQLAKRPLKFDDFDPGTEKEPEAEGGDGAILRLESALLTEAGEFRVRYWHQLPIKPSRLRLAIRTPGEQRPRAFLNVPNKESGLATVHAPEPVLKDAHGTILASLVAEVGDERLESPPIWVIHEGRLTYEPGGEGSSSAKSKVEESGEGLTEFLEELGKRDGVAAVIEYLRHLNIRFNDGSGGLRSGRAFRLRIRDPFHPDVAPDWLLNAKDNANSLAEALYDFVDRHEKYRLRRHAKRGNINGMENFLDIFTALVRLLYVYHVRGVVKRGGVVGPVICCIEVATAGVNTKDQTFNGYLLAVADNLQDEDVLQQASDKVNFAGHIRAALMIAQRVRFDPKESDRYGPAPKRPKDCLPTASSKVRDTFAHVGLAEPSKKDVMDALEQYQMFSDKELTELRADLHG